jgi:hypothetical protein
MAGLRIVPYVAYPFGSERVRSKLVGLLLHPISRSETWRRLLILQANSTAAPGAEQKFDADFTWPTCRLRGTEQPIDNDNIVTDPGQFPKQKLMAIK